MERAKQELHPDDSRLGQELLLRSERRWFLFAVAYCGLYLLLSLALRGHVRLLSWFGNVAQIVVVALALQMTGLAAIRHRHAGRTFWTLWAAACYCYLLVCLFWAGSELILNEPDVGYFPETDIPAFLHAIFLLGALFWRPERKESSAHSPRRLFDFLLVFGAVLYLYFYAVGVHYIVRGSEATYLRHYDFLQAGKNVTVAVLLVVRARQARHTAWKPVFALLAVGGVTYAIGNAIVNAAITRNAYHTGSVYDLGLIVPFFCYAIAARHSRHNIGQFQLPLLRPFSMDSGTGSTVSAFLMVAAMPIMDRLWRHFSPAAPAVEEFRENLTEAILVLAIVLIGGRQIVVQQVGAKLFRQLDRVYRKLRRFQTRLRDVVEYSDDWMFSADMEGRFTMTNPAIVSLLGYRPEEILGRPVQEFLWPGALHEFAHLTKELLWAKRYRGPLSFRTQQGDQVILEGQMSLIESEGVPAGIRGVARDVTEITHLRRQVEQSERHYRELVENASDIIFSCKADGTLVSMNRAGCRILGRSKEELLGRPWSEMISPDSAALVAFALDRLTSTSNFNLIVGLHNAAGEARDFEFVFSVEEGESRNGGLIRGVGRDVTESIQKKKELEAQAVTDALTGCYNRRFFGERINQEVVKCQRSETPCSLLMLDMDGLKKINDTRGHSAGDEAVQAVAAVLMHLTRRSDTVARLGGDEFAVLLDGCPAGTAVTLVERILRAMARQRISSGEPLAVSIGIATYPEDGQTAQELEKAADDALYLAKGRGGNQFAVHQETLRGG